MHVPNTAIQAGDQLDHYRLDSVVALSGMATVFRATDLDTGIQVAIKVPHPEMEGDPILYDRFQREQDIGTRMQHSGVMKVLPNPDRTQVYMVMEWLDGRLLRTIMNEEKPLPLDRAVGITIGISEALEYIHSQGVVHRDLKPENVMVDADDQIRLIDFGIAANAGARRLTFANFSQSMGTPDYISPEQVRGKRGDERSDVYSLGVMLYEMLTPEMQEILYRALEREPKNRYANAREFAHDLKHPETVGVTERLDEANWQKRQSPGQRRILFYVLLALLPVAVLVLLLIVARRP